VPNQVTTHPLAHDGESRCAGPATPGPHIPLDATEYSLAGIPWATAATVRFGERSPTGSGASAEEVIAIERAPTITTELLRKDFGLGWCQRTASPCRPELFDNSSQAMTAFLSPAHNS
jgi:hypothetical protein